MTSGHIGARLEEFVAKRLCAFMQNIDEDIRWRREGRGGRAGGRGSVEPGEITKKKELIFPIARENPIVSIQSLLSRCNG